MYTSPTLNACPEEGTHFAWARFDLVLCVYMYNIFVSFCTHLLSVLFLHRLEVGPEVHGDFVLGAQQRAKDSVSRHTNTSEVRPLEFPPEVQHLDVQVFNLDQG